MSGPYGHFEGANHNLVVHGLASPWAHLPFSVSRLPPHFTTQTTTMMMAMQTTMSYARSRSATVVCSASGRRAHSGALNSRRAAVLLGLAGGMAIASPWNANALIPDGTTISLLGIDVLRPFWSEDPTDWSSTLLSRAHQPTPSCTHTPHLPGRSQTMMRRWSSRLVRCRRLDGFDSPHPPTLTPTLHAPPQVPIARASSPASGRRRRSSRGLRASWTKMPRKTSQKSSWRYVYSRRGSSYFPPYTVPDSPISLSLSLSLNNRSTLSPRSGMPWPTDPSGMPPPRQGRSMPMSARR